MQTLTSYSIRAERVTLILVLILAVLIVVHVLAMQANYNSYLGLKDKYGFHYWQLEFFDLDAEESFGTWFNSGLLMLSAILCLLQARILRSRGAAMATWWWILGAGFCVLSIEEVAGMHEWVNTMLEDTSWTVIGAPFFAVVGLAYLPFLWHHRWRSGLLFLLAGAIYGAGAVGVEHFTDSEVNSLHYNMWTALEEGMEMLGVIVFIYAVLDQLREEPDKALRLKVGIGADKE